MEKINNKKGSMTVEGVFIIPIIMIFIVIFVLVMIVSYEKTVQIISVHRMAMIGKVEEFSVISETNVENKGSNYSAEAVFKINGEEKNITYKYKNKMIETRDIQEIIELVFYLMDEYDERLKGFKKNDKK